MNTMSLLPYIYDKFVIFMLAFTRITALFATFTLFRRDYVNSRIIIAISFILTFYVMMINNPPNLNINEVFSLSMLMQEGLEFLIGMIAGLVLNITFEIFVALGQIISAQIGISMASLIDPKFGSITTLSHFYLVTIMLVFLLTNGHLLVIKTLLDSFNTLPIAKISLSKSMLTDVAQYTAVIFSESILLSIVVIATMMITNITLAVMTRFAPQFNVFSIGINLSLILGLVIVYLTFGIIIDSADRIINQSFTVLDKVLLRAHPYGG